MYFFFVICEHTPHPPKIFSYVFFNLHFLLSLPSHHHPISDHDDESSDDTCCNSLTRGAACMGAWGMGELRSLATTSHADDGS